MADGLESSRLLGRLNNFSSLRIAFAALVILSHSFELIEGNRSREFLTRLFGTISFGVFSVDGFFIVSGYLIAQSYLNSTTPNYVIKRILRIYPAFIVAFLVSLGLGYLSLSGRPPIGAGISHNLFRMCFLLPPAMDNPYPSSRYPALNGAMCTISYEFHCYMLLIFLGFLGLLKKKSFLVLLTLLLLICYAIHPNIYIAPVYHPMAPNPSYPPHETVGLFKSLRSALIENHLQDIRLFGIFLVGSCFYVFRHAITYKTSYAGLAAILLIACLFSDHLAEPGLAIFGAYLIFWFAFHIKELGTSKLFNKTDISYGVYLYGWPIQKTLIFLLPSINPYELFVSSMFICSSLAYVSWTMVESPCLKLKDKIRLSSTSIHLSNSFERQTNFLARRMPRKREAQKSDFSG